MLKEQLKKYLSGQIDINEFYHWFMPATWDMDEECEEYRMSTKISLWLAEYTNFTRDGKRHRSEEDIKKLFQGLI